MSRKNPFDDAVTNLVGAMKEQASHFDAFSKDVQPFDSTKLSEAEEAHLYEYPIDFFPGEQLTIQEARLDLIEKMGPARYVKWVMETERKRGRVAQ